MIYERIDARSLQIDARELSARLGAPTDPSDDAVAAVLERIYSVANPAYTAIRVKIKRENGDIYIGRFKSESTGLRTLLSDSSECILLAATLGAGVDRLLLKMSGTSAHDAFVADAVADALIEALCDLAEEKITDGLVTSGRFSPGYSDLELAMGEEILALTDSGRMLGIRLTDGGMMIPRKSVNAIIAIKNVQV